MSLREADGLLTVGPPEAVPGGVPRRDWRPSAVRLTPGQWLRWQINYRFGGCTNWTYRLDTFKWLSAEAHREAVEAGGHGRGHGIFSGAPLYGSHTSPNGGTATTRSPVRCRSGPAPPADRPGRAAWNRLVGAASGSPRQTLR